MTRLSYERNIQLLALAAGFPGSLIALILLWTGDFSSGTAWTLTLVIVSLWLGFAASLRQRVVFSLQTLSNLLAAMREEDFSLRGRGARNDDAMGEVMLEINALSETLRTQRLGAIEATALLRTVMEEIDLAIFAFDDKSQLRLVNRAGERLLDRPTARLLGFTAEELELAPCLQGAPARTAELNFSGGSGRWGLRRVSFRQGGLPHQLLVLSDLSRTLRDEERQAWQRLIRVLGHELNNSLAPIQSVAQSLESGLQTALRAPELHDSPATPVLDDLRQGLSIIRSRTEALGRFMAAYARLARLPQPHLAPIDAGGAAMAAHELVGDADADDGSDHGVGAGGGQAAPPGGEVPEDGGDQEGEDHGEACAFADLEDELDGQQRDDGEGHGAGAEEDSGEVHDAGVDDGYVGLERVGVDAGGDGVGCVVEAVDELEAERDEQGETEQDVWIN